MAQATTDNTTSGCSVIQFAAHRRPAEKPRPLAAFREVMRVQEDAKIAELTTFPQGMTITKRNLRLRLERRRVWRDAYRLTDWWDARVKFQWALEMAQANDVGDANSYASVVSGERFVLVDLWRAAVVSQILTPAPDAGAVIWKRAAIRRVHRHVAVAEETLHKAIADDLQWLKDHPTRRVV